jgi:hypothetical protein
VARTLQQIEIDKLIIPVLLCAICVTFLPRVWRPAQQ